jgi:hypothetical protein
MSNEKTFTIAGVSLCKGMYKVRHANDTARIKTLEKTGHTEIVLVELPNAMTKVAAAEFIADLPEFAYAEAQVAITSLLDTAKAAVEPKEPKVKAEKVVKEKKAKVTDNTVTVKPAIVPEAERESFTLEEALAAEFAEDEDYIDLAADIVTTEDENAPF